MAGGFRVREQKFICGKDYAAAETMQVDFFEITEQQHKASTRKKKELASSIAKEAYNFRQSGRYLELLIQNGLLRYIHLRQRPSARPRRHGARGQGFFCRDEKAVPYVRQGRNRTPRMGGSGRVYDVY